MRLSLTQAAALFHWYRLYGMVEGPCQVMSQGDVNSLSTRSVFRDGPSVDALSDSFGQTASADTPHLATHALPPGPSGAKSATAGRRERMVGRDIPWPSASAKVGIGSGPTEQAFSEQNSGGVGRLGARNPAATSDAAQQGAGTWNCKISGDMLPNAPRHADKASSAPKSSQTLGTTPRGTITSFLPPYGPDQPKETALDALRAAMQAFQGCDLSKTAQNMVFGDGPLDASIMAVGEAPGAQEDEQGKPFVGMSGQLLDRMLASIGLTRAHIYISNVVPWRPPFNRQPSSAEIAACLPFIERHIQIIRPRVLICVGGVAARSLLRTALPMGTLLGQTLQYVAGEGASSDPSALDAKGALSDQNVLGATTIPAFALYHPAYLLRSPSQKRAAWHQLLRIRAFLESLPPRQGE